MQRGLFGSLGERTMAHSILLSLGFSAALATVGCGAQQPLQTSTLQSQSTQRWSISDNSPVVTTYAESGSCAPNLQQASLVGEFCFNAIPVAEISVSVSSGKLTSLCVATHLSDSATDAALVVVDRQGQIVAESLGRQNFQILASLPGNGTYRVFAGFPTATPGQKVKVLAGRSEQFALGTAACSAR